MSNTRSLSRALAWPAIESFSGLVINALSALLIARMIGAEAFGVASVALGVALMVLVAINTFVHDAMVRMPDLTEDDLDSAFTASILFAVFCMLVTGGIGVLMGEWLAQPVLPLLIGSFLPLFLLSAVTTPLLAERRRAMDFSTVAQHQIVGRVIGCIAALWLTLSGLGLWALSALHVAMAAYLAVAMFGIAPRRPGLRLSIGRLKPMLTFTAPLIASQFLRQGTSRLFLFVIATWHGFAATGHWSVVMRLSESIVGGLNYVIYMVALAKFARLQNDRERLVGAMKQAQVAFVVMALPTFTAIAAAAGPLFVLLLGPSWEPAGALAAGPVAGAFILARQVLPVAVLHAIGDSKASLTAGLATVAVAAVSLAVVAAWSPEAIAAVYPMAFLAGYLMVRRALAHGVAAPLGADLLALIVDLACAGAAYLLAQQVAAAVGGSALFTFLITGTVAFLAALVLVVVVRLPMLYRALQSGEAAAALDGVFGADSVDKVLRRTARVVPSAAKDDTGVVRIDAACQRTGTGQAGLARGKLGKVDECTSP